LPPAPPNSPEPAEPNSSVEALDFSPEMSPLIMQEPQPLPLGPIPRPVNPDQANPAAPPNTPEPEVEELPLPPAPP